MYCKIYAQKEELNQSPNLTNFQLRFQGHLFMLIMMQNEIFTVGPRTQEESSPTHHRTQLCKGPYIAFGPFSIQSRASISGYTYSKLQQIKDSVPIATCHVV